MPHHTPHSPATTIAVVNADGTGKVTLPDGTEHQFNGENPDLVRNRIIFLLRERAATLNGVVLVRTIEPDGSCGGILVAPDGSITPQPAPPAVAEEPHSTPSAPEQPTGPSSLTAAPGSAVISQPPQEEPMPVATLPKVWRVAIMEKNSLGEAGTFQPPSRIRHIVVISLKGGVGKTTTAIGLGNELAYRYSERVIALDGNHYGTLTTRFPSQSDQSMPDLAQAQAEVDSFVALRRYLSTNPARLHAMNGGGHVGDYEVAAEFAERYADVVITDCRTDLDDPTVKAALLRATHCVIVIEPSQDATAAGQNTLDHLTQNYPELAQTAVVAECHRTQTRTRGLFRRPPEPTLISSHPTIPIGFDNHLHSGGVIDHQRLRRSTRAAYARLAEMVVGG